MSPYRPRISPAWTSKRDVIEQVAAAEPRQRHVLDLQQRLAHVVLGAAEQRGRRAAHHLLDDPGHVDVGRLGVGHDPAVAQHGDVVADLQQLFELVADVDDGHAARLEVAR